MSQCWAHNKQGWRCELDAGHEDIHRISFTWNDDECLIPNAKQKTAAEPPAASPNPSEPVPQCVACKHSHKGGLCKCGCHTHIG